MSTRCVFVFQSAIIYDMSTESPPQLGDLIRAIPNSFRTFQVVSRNWRPGRYRDFDWELEIQLKEWQG